MGSKCTSECTKRLEKWSLLFSSVYKVMQLCYQMFTMLLEIDCKTSNRRFFNCLSNNFKFVFFVVVVFSVWLFFQNHSRINGLQGKGEGISLTPHYHFYPLHRHLEISRAITAESSPLHIGSSRTRTKNLWFPSASR